MFTFQMRIFSYFLRVSYEVCFLFLGVVLEHSFVFWGETLKHL
jgi:hypothetical protein